MKWIVVEAIAILLLIILVRVEFRDRRRRRKLRDRASERLDKLIIEAEVLNSAYEDYRLHTASVVYRAEKIDEQITGMVKDTSRWLIILEDIIRPTYQSTGWYIHGNEIYNRPGEALELEERADQWLWNRVVAPLGGLFYSKLYQKIKRTTREDERKLNLIDETVDDLLEGIALALAHIEYATTPSIRAKANDMITPIEFRNQMVNGQVEAKKKKARAMKILQDQKEEAKEKENYEKTS
jgi:hypothetical protein